MQVKLQFLYFIRSLPLGFWGDKSQVLEPHYEESSALTGLLYEQVQPLN